MKRWFGRGDDGGHSESGASRTGVEDADGLREALDALIGRVKASASRLPTGAVVEVREIGDRLEGLLDHAERSEGAHTYEFATLVAVVRDYLPTSVDTYLALPTEFRENHRNAEGQTPDEDLHEQLLVLDKGVSELAQAMYSGDAQRFSIQGRFLDARFSGSDLNL